MHKEFIDADEFTPQEISSEVTMHPEAIYISRHMSFTNLPEPTNSTRVQIENLEVSEPDLIERLINVAVQKQDQVSKFKFQYFFRISSSLFFSPTSDANALQNIDDYNVIIQVGENQNIKEFHAHSNILRARSPYFKSAFSAGWISKKDDNTIEFKKPNINPNILKRFLSEVDLTNQPGENILGLLVASDEFLLEELLIYVQDYVIEKKSAWIENNFVLVLHATFKFSSCRKLQDHCLESICANPQPFIASKEFPSLDKDILYNLFKRDELNIKEIVVWDYLIKWGIQQTPELGIRPYKAVITYNIYEEVMEFYMKNTLPKILNDFISTCRKYSN
ncbi:hypothetical protein C1646_672400 [Rhizophagus diaphanus]|nr:hypothetical protein C1646_672400 [Rhizophagus diaphanus] [Rhizophagus sp. MUCL 43196]